MYFTSGRGVRSNEYRAARINSESPPPGGFPPPAPQPPRGMCDRALMCACAFARVFFVTGVRGSVKRMIKKINYTATRNIIIGRVCTSTLLVVLTVPSARRAFYLFSPFFFFFSRISRYLCARNNISLSLLLLLFFFCLLFFRNFTIPSHNDVAQRVRATDGYTDAFDLDRDADRDSYCPPDHPSRI